MLNQYIWTTKHAWGRKYLFIKYVEMYFYLLFSICQVAPQLSNLLTDSSFLPMVWRPQYLVLLSKKESVATPISLGMSWIPKGCLVFSLGTVTRVIRNAKTLGYIGHRMIKDPFQILRSQLNCNYIPVIEFSIYYSSN